MSASDAATLNRTPLYALHASLGAKMVPFAGYEMPVHYAAGILREHLHTRASAGLFDVSHMGQAFLAGSNPALALEAVTPADIIGLKDGQMRYHTVTDPVYVPPPGLNVGVATCCWIV